MDSRSWGLVRVGSLLLVLVCGRASLARRADSEEDLLARIQRETNPTRKAKYEIRLARLKLQQAIDAYDQGHLDLYEQLLAAYVEHMRGSWEALRSSGRRASRHPQGFKELDIALREDTRLLEDLQRRIPYLDRGPVEKAAQQVKELRDEVLRALFPPERARNGWVAPASLLPLTRDPTRVASFLAPPALAEPQQGEFLTEEEQDKLREAQDPSQRIEVYLGLAQARLDQFEEFRKQPPDPRYHRGSYLNSLLDHYVALNEELKNWIQDHYEREGDMRHGLRALLERGPKQLEQLRRIGQYSGPEAREYKDSLRDAIDDLTDTLDGATKALADQEKKFTEAKRQEKVEARASKEKRKEEEKKNKQENKLRKRQRKKGGLAEPDEP